MPTVAEVSGPYANHLLPVLPSEDGICDICHTTCPGWPRCYQCKQATRTLTHVGDAVDFVALAVKGEQLARELWVYKNADLHVRASPTIGLAAVLWRWLAVHEPCVALAAGVDAFSMVTCVPSASGRPDHPLPGMVGEMVGATAGRYAALLEADRQMADDRTPDDHRFRPLVRIPTAAAVLLVDDTWTSGAHAQSAASALKEAGAERVGIVAIGRHFNREQAGDFREPAEAYYRSARARDWDWDTCCLCDDR